MKTFLVFFSSLLCVPAWSQTPLGVNFRWHISHHCSNTSPLIKLKNIPPGTTHLVINMVDLDNKNHDHGGATLIQPEGFPAEYDIAAGGLDKYIGPCPENFTTLGHEYQFNVSAMSSDHKNLASGSAKATFSAKFVILQGVIGNQ